MYCRCVKSVFYSAFVRKCTDMCKHRFVVQLLQNPPLCRSTLIKAYQLVVACIYVPFYIWLESPCKLRFLYKEKRRKKKQEYLLKCWEESCRELVSGGGLGRRGELCFILQARKVAFLTLPELDTPHRSAQWTGYTCTHNRNQRSQTHTTLQTITGLNISSSVTSLL